LEIRQLLGEEVIRFIRFPLIDSVLQMALVGWVQPLGKKKN
jgi:hypothetical protein